MNGTKVEEKGGHGLCCSSSMRMVYLGLILFVIGLMMQNQNSIPQMIMIIGGFTAIVSLITLFSHKNR